MTRHAPNPDNTRTNVTLKNFGSIHASAVGNELDSLDKHTFVLYVYLIPTPHDPLFGIFLDNVFNDYSIPVYTNQKYAK